MWRLNTGKLWHSFRLRVSEVNRNLQVTNAYKWTTSTDLSESCSVWWSTNDANLMKVSIRVATIKRPKYIWLAYFRSDLAQWSASLLMSLLMKYDLEKVANPKLSIQLKSRFFFKTWINLVCSRVWGHGCCRRQGTANNISRNFALIQDVIDEAIKSEPETSQYEESTSLMTEVNKDNLNKDQGSRQSERETMGHTM